MSRTLLALSLSLAASVGCVTSARAQYNDPNNQYNLQRQQGGGFVLPSRQTTPPPQDNPQPQENPQRLDQRLDTPYRIDQGCPSCR